MGLRGSLWVKMIVVAGAAGLLGAVEVASLTAQPEPGAALPGNKVGLLMALEPLSLEQMSCRRLQAADSWELAHGLDPLNPADDGADPDLDGLPNACEAALGTDPWLEDTDGGGAPDGWEVMYRMDPVRAADEQWDRDADGWSNAREFAEGTNPLTVDADWDCVFDPVDAHPTDFAYRLVDQIRTCDDPRVIAPAAVEGETPGAQG